MTNDEFHARRTELANACAGAAAEWLDFMGAGSAMAAIPNTQQYIVAGSVAAIRAQLDTVAPQRRMRHGDRPRQPLYFGPEAGQERRWAALITSAGHGILQEYGSAFEHAQPGQEVLEVMEILPGAPAIANKAEVDLESIEQYRQQMAGISTAAFGYWKEGDGIHPDYDTVPLRDVAKLYAKYEALATPPATTGASTVPTDAERLYKAWHKIGADVAGLKFGDFMSALGSVGASTAFMPTALTDERIIEVAESFDLLSIQDGGRVDRSALLDFARDVAAQAGQVAVPEKLVADIEAIADELEAEAANYEGDFADTVNGCAEALRHIAAPSPAKESK